MLGFVCILFKTRESSSFQSKPIAGKAEIAGKVKKEVMTVLYDANI